MKMSKDSSIILILHPTISNLLPHSYCYLLISYGECKIKGIISAHAKNSFFLSLLSYLTLDTMSKHPTYSIHSTFSESVHLENFRLLPFTSSSKVQIELLSCFKFNFTSSSTLKIHSILAPIDIMGRFILATMCSGSQCLQVKNILLVDSLLSQHSHMKFNFH